MTNQSKANAIIDNINKYFVGKNEAVELAVITLLSGGHLLIEDVPGVGKTTLGNLIARSVGCGFNRIQFTPDTLPGDVTGTNVYNMKSGEFKFMPGAIMNNIVLIDEINRTSPKTQAALLEAMQERQVTADGKTYKIDDPFMVIATQNPIEFIGTYNLPEAQLDRFLMRISIGYPDVDEEVNMSLNFLEGKTPEKAEAVIDKETLIKICGEVKSVRVCKEIADYTVFLVTATREHKLVSLGGSPRATLALIAASQGAAYIKGRDYVIPDDVLRVLPYVLCHRIMLTVEARMNKNTPETIIDSIKNRVKVPIM